MSREQSSARWGGKQPVNPTPTAAPSQPRIVQTTPAQLASFAIYNPSLGPTDETLEQQIVFETSRKSQSLNEKLRQIGLAQGMVEFARGFAKKEALNTYLTKKTRVIIKEVEKGWWILAHIDLTTYPSPSDPTKPEYTPRDLSPPSILLSQVDTAYSEYILLHGTFADGFSKGRADFSKRLARFWKYWCWNWEVLLSADPADSISPKAIRMAKPHIAGNLTASIKAFEDKWSGKGLSQMALYRVPTSTDDEPEEQPRTTAQSSLRWSSYLWPTTYLTPSSPKTSQATPKFVENTLGTLYTSSTTHDPTLWSLTRTASASPQTSYLATGGNVPVKKRRKRQEPTRQRRSESVSRTSGATLHPPKRDNETRGIRSASVGPWNRRSLPPPPTETTPTQQEQEGGGVEDWLGYLTFGITTWGMSPLWGGEGTTNEQHTPLPVPPSLIGLSPPNIPPPPSTSPPLPTTSSINSGGVSKSSSKRGSLLIPAAIPVKVDGQELYLVLYTPPSPPPALPSKGDPFEIPVETVKRKQNLIYTLLFNTSPTKQTVREIDRDLSLIAAYPLQLNGETGVKDAVGALQAVKPAKFEFQLLKSSPASPEASPEDPQVSHDSLYGDYARDELVSTFPAIPLMLEEYDETRSQVRQEVVDLWKGFLALREMGGGRVRVRSKGTQGNGGWWVEWEGNSTEGRGSALRCRV